jgi:hypothetical protein
VSGDRDLILLGRGGESLRSSAENNINTIMMMKALVEIVILKMFYTPDSLNTKSKYFKKFPKPWLLRKIRKKIQGKTQEVIFKES